MAQAILAQVLADVCLMEALPVVRLFAAAVTLMLITLSQLIGDGLSLSQWMDYAKQEPMIASALYKEVVRPHAPFVSLPSVKSALP